MSYRLGLTGSIGMGKSTTAEFFREAGVPVWDADDAVHRLYAAGGAAVGPISSLCPDAIQYGAVDRAALKAWIAADESALKKIESVVHPLVAADRAQFLSDHADAPILLLDIPLLFETNAETWLDGVLVVTTSPEEQRRRVMTRPGMDEETFHTILARQTPDAEKCARADFIIETISLEQTRAAVETLIAKITERLDA